MKSIIKTIISAFSALNANRIYLLKALAIPFVLICIFKYLDPEEDKVLQELISSLICGISYCYMAILTHRIIIIGPESVPTFGIYKPTSREISFAGHLIGFSLFTVPFIIIFSLLPNLPTKIVIPILSISAVS